MDVCLIATFWLGGRRFADPRQLRDPYFHLRQQCRTYYDGTTRSNLSRLVLVLAVEQAVDMRLVREAIGELVDRPHVHLLVRHNVGISYGGFSEAFAMFPHHQHYVLNEDDYCFIEDHFDRQLVEWIERSPRIGCVCGHVHPVPPRHPGFFAGIYRGDAMRAIYSRLGCLPHSPTRLDRYIPNPQSQLSDYSPHEMYGQIGWGTALEREGYLMVDWLRYRSTPFWNQRAIVWYGDQKLPPFMLPSVAIDRQVEAENGPPICYDYSNKRYLPQWSPP